MGLRESAEGASPRQIKRRRARLRAAGIEPTGLPGNYVHAGTVQRVAMVLRGEVPPEVGSADTSRRVQRAALQVAWIERGYQELTRAQLTELAGQPGITVQQLEGLAAEIIARQDWGQPLALLCEHLQCPTTILRLAVARGRQRAVRAAVQQLIRRGEATGADLRRLHPAQRVEYAGAVELELAQELVTDPDSRVREALAQRPLRDDAQVLLATDPHPGVRLTLAGHTRDPRVLEWLRSDGHPKVRAAARKRSNELNL